MLGDECVPGLRAEACGHRSFPCPNYIKTYLIAGLIEAHGYQLTVTELVGWEHSMKNELIIARHTGAPRKNAMERIEAILSELNLTELRSRFAC